MWLCHGVARMGQYSTMKTKYDNAGAMDFSIAWLTGRMARHGRLPVPFRSYAYARKASTTSPIWPEILGCSVGFH